MHGTPRKPLATSLVALALAVSALTLIPAAPAAARTICDAYGRCYNTSGAPIYNGPDWRHRHYWPHHHWHHDDDRY